MIKFEDKEKEKIKERIKELEKEYLEDGYEKEEIISSDKIIEVLEFDVQCSIEDNLLLREKIVVDVEDLLDMIIQRIFGL